MGLIEFVFDVLSVFDYQPFYEKPRRVFTRGFVVFCVVVAVLELMTLNYFYGGHG